MISSENENQKTMIGILFFHQIIKVTQINYISRNQLYSTANLNFGSMGKKAKHCWASSTNFSVQFSWQFFLIVVCFLLNWCRNSNFFKIAVWQSDSMKWNYRGFTFNWIGIGLPKSYDILKFFLINQIYLDMSDATGILFQTFSEAETSKAKIY